MRRAAASTAGSSSPLARKFVEAYLRLPQGFEQPGEAALRQQLPRQQVMSLKTGVVVGHPRAG